MYKYYSLERPISLGTYPKRKDNPILAFENFENNFRCKKELVTDNDKVFEAWGYLIFPNPLTSKEISDYEIGDAGCIPRTIKISALPFQLRQNLLDEINGFYKKAMSSFRMTEEGFNDMYGSFTLDDFQKMMPNIANKYHFINDKNKSPLEKLMDGNIKFESILDNMEAKKDEASDLDYRSDAEESEIER